MRIRFEAPRGMRDFYPEQVESRNAVFDAWSRAARLFGFSQYDSCVVETLELLKHKSGQEIVEQVYAFRDKSDRDLALRPEMTPTLARMIAARQGSLSFPLKWFAIAQCFRYERASRGRKREHYQWNLDVVGEPSISAEAEIIACALHSLSLLGLQPGEVFVHLSSRALLSDILSVIGIAQEKQPAVFLALDKKGKLDDDSIAALLKGSGLDQGEIESVFRIAATASVEDAARLLGGMPPSLQDIRDLLDKLSLYGVRDSIKFDPTIVRGLDYYTGIVFEAFDAAREFRAVFGGGRYDRLMEDMGASPLTAVGLGFGDVVIGELLTRKEKGQREERMGFAIGYMEDAQRPAAINLARRLRAAGSRVDLGLHAEKAKHFFARSGNGLCLNAVYIGPDDVARGAVRIKNLADRTETEEPITGAS